MAQPDLILIPFGENANPGTINDIPETVDSGAPAQSASWNAGFPQVTMTPLSAGGIPPRGQDVNGALRAISRHTAFTGGGGQYKWSPEYVAKNGGYPAGSVIQSNDGRSAYVSLVDGNNVDFNVTPSSIGPLWQIYSGAGLIQSQASESVAGIARIASQTQVDAGVDDSTISTPKKIKAAAYIVEKITGENCRNAGLTAGGTQPYMQRLSDGVVIPLATEEYVDNGLLTRIAGEDCRNAGFTAGGAVPYLQRFSDGVTFQLATRQIVIGIDQSWQDMTASRAKGVTYTNNTGRPIQIFINFDPDGGLSVLRITGHNFNVNDNSSEFVSAIIPAGGTYSLSAWGTATTMKWLELR